MGDMTDAVSRILRDPARSKRAMVAAGKNVSQRKIINDNSELDCWTCGACHSARFRIREGGLMTCFDCDSLTRDKLWFNPLDENENA